MITGVTLASPAIFSQNKPVYLDTTKPIEQRVEDALSRMSLSEKIAIIHAQSKFCSPGVARLGIPDLWCTDGPHGIRAEVKWDEWEQAGWSNDSCFAFRLSLVWLLRGTRGCRIFMVSLSAKRLDTGIRMCCWDRA
jgi:beta-glucosidase